jgi:pyruvate-ferredoxin/flavodoxin oxidoreductase
LDSNAPSRPVKEFMYEEARFKRVAEDNPEIAELLLAEAQEKIDANWEKLELFRDI